MRRPRNCLLLVDDDTRNLLTVEAVLEPCGYRLVRALDGSTALELFETEGPDVVLCDLMMPGMDGVEVLRRIRSHPDRGHTPVVLLTAYGEREHRLRALQAGADDFLDKPLDAPILLARIATLLRLKHSRDDLAQRHEALQRLQREQREVIDCLATDVTGAIDALRASADWLDAYAESGPAVVHEAASRIRDGLEGLASTVRDLSWVSWLDSFEFPVKRTIVALDKLVGEVVAKFEPGAAERSIELRTALGVGIEVSADARLLRRVVENLLDNAVRHTPTGGSVRLEVRISNGDELYVCNEGAGIPVSERDRIFEKFVRAKAEPASLGHPGLGLYFCRRALAVQGAEIEVADEPGWPTTFVIRFPRASGSAAERSAGDGN